MAAPPQSRSLTIDRAGDTQAQLDSTVKQLNEFMNSVAIALSGGIGPENLQRQVKVLRIGKGQLYPVAFDCTLSVRPSTLRLDQTTTVSGPAPTVAVDVSQWRLNGASRIEILAIPGLSLTGEYDLTLEVT